MKLFFLGLVFSAAAMAADPGPMLRFWRGFVDPGANEERLLSALNAKLLPETLVVGAGKGLAAYLPAFYPAYDSRDRKQPRPRFLPVETALVAYVSEELYLKIRSTPEGTAYGKLHFEDGMFKQRTSDGFVSGSEVAVPYEGKVTLKAPSVSQTEASAFGIGANEVDWQKSYGFLETLLTKDIPAEDVFIRNVETYLTQLEDFRKQDRLQGALVLVNRKYLISLFSFKDQAQAVDFSRSSAFVPSGFEVYDGFANGVVAAGAKPELGPRKLLNFEFEVGKF